MQDVLSETQKDIINYLETVKQNSSAIDKPNPSGHSEVSQLFKSLSEQIFYEQISPEDAAVKFREQVNAVLTK
ncbi:putative ABC transporter substrate-binding protein YesO [compost metagenome]